MKHYTIKKLIRGYTVKSTLKSTTLIGIPHEAKYQNIMVTHKDLKMLITKESPLLHKEMFKDKFRPNRYYVLYYYEWMPNTFQKTLF
jgi:hypothetical protein